MSQGLAGPPQLRLTFLNRDPLPVIDTDRCLACHNCVVLCQKLGPNVLDVVGESARVVRPMKCISDGACILACPTQALTMGDPPRRTGPADAA